MLATDFSITSNCAGGFAQEHIDQLRERVGLLRHAQLAEAGDDNRINHRVQGLLGSAIGQGAVQGGFQFRQLNRLVDEIIHARRQAFLPAVRLGIGGHGDNVGVRRCAGGMGLLRFSLADLPRGLVTAHFGHAAIHEDDVISAASDGCESLGAVGNSIRAA